jgi:hypothetical protein
MVMHTEHRHLGAECEPCTTPTLVTSTCPCLSSRLFEVRSPTISTFDIRHLTIRDPRKKTLWAIPHPSALYVSSAYQLGMRSSTNVRDTYRARPRYGIGRLGILPNISISWISGIYPRLFPSWREELCFTEYSLRKHYNIWFVQLSKLIEPTSNIGVISDSIRRADLSILFKC